MILGTLPSVCLIIFGIFLYLIHPNEKNALAGVFYLAAFSVVYLFYFVPSLFSLGALIGLILGKFKPKQEKT
jgi:uncharacterized protein YqgC (DUF456 family)